MIQRRPCNKLHIDVVAIIVDKLLGKVYYLCVCTLITIFTEIIMSILQQCHLRNVTLFGTLGGTQVLAASSLLRYCI